MTNIFDRWVQDELETTPTPPPPIGNAIKVNLNALERRRALADEEDLGSGDTGTFATVPDDSKSFARRFRLIPCFGYVRKNPNEEPQFAYWLFDTARFSLSTRGEKGLTTQLFDFISGSLSDHMRTISSIPRQEYGKQDFRLVYKEVKDKKKTKSVVELDLSKIRANDLEEEAKLRDIAVRDFAAAIGEKLISNNLVLGTALGVSKNQYNHKYNSADEKRAAALMAFVYTARPANAKYNINKMYNVILSEEKALSENTIPNDYRLTRSTLETFIKRFFTKFTNKSGISYDILEALYGPAYQRSGQSAGYNKNVLRLISMMGSPSQDYRGGSIYHQGIIPMFYDKEEGIKEFNFDNKEKLGKLSFEKTIDIQSEIKKFVNNSDMVDDKSIDPIAIKQALVDEEHPLRKALMRLIVQKSLSLHKKIHKGSFDMELQYGPYAMISSYFAQEISSELLFESASIDLNKFALRNKMNDGELIELTKYYYSSTTKFLETLDVMERNARKWTTIVKDKEALLPLAKEGSIDDKLDFYKKQKLNDEYKMVYNSLVKERAKLDNINGKKNFLLGLTNEAIDAIVARFKTSGRLYRVEKDEVSDWGKRPIIPQKSYHDPLKDWYEQAQVEAKDYSISGLMSSYMSVLYSLNEIRLKYNINSAENLKDYIDNKKISLTDLNSLDDAYHLFNTEALHPDFEGLRGKEQILDRWKKILNDYVHQYGAIVPSSENQTITGRRLGRHVSAQNQSSKNLYVLIKNGKPAITTSLAKALKESYDAEKEALSMEKV